MQTMLSQYCGMAPYRGLAHIDVVRPFAEASDGGIMREAGRIICDAQVEGLAGVSLLHEHFKLNGDEIWYEWARGAEIISAPVMWRALGQEVHPMIYRLTHDGGAIPIHWRHGADPYAEKMAAFLRVATPRLLEVFGDEVNRFGIVRAPTYPEFLDGQIMKEVSVPEDRLLVSKWSIAGDDRMIGTAWFFQASGYAGPRFKCSSICLKTPTGGHEVGHFIPD